MLLSDLRHALRQLARMPGFTLTAILTFALGIGANSAIFSVVNGVLRHPAGVDYPERVAVMKVRYPQFMLDIPFVSVPDLVDAASLKDHVEAASLARDTNFNIVHDGTVEHLPAERVGVQWFQVFGARPILGRTFAPEEDHPGAGPVVVISYGLWQRAFGGRHDVLGRNILLDQKPYQVIGVMRSDFDWPRGKQLWVPIALDPQAFSPYERFNEYYTAFCACGPASPLPSSMRASRRRCARRSFRKGRTRTERAPAGPCMPRRSHNLLPDPYASPLTFSSVSWPWCF